MSICLLQIGAHYANTAHYSVNLIDEVALRKDHTFVVLDKQEVKSTCVRSLTHVVVRKECITYVCNFLFGGCLSKVACSAHTHCN